jgi:ADP-heptose:LPS heptosyltransferase
MHILELDRPVVLDPTQTIEAGKWLLTDINAAEVLINAGGGKMWPAKDYEHATIETPVHDGVVWDTLSDFNESEILFVRPGGYGDIVLLTPVLREFNRRWPTCRICVSTINCYGAVLKGLPFVDEILPYPVSLARAESFDMCFFYENTVENNPRAKLIPMTDLFAEVAGLDSIEDKKPAYVVSDMEKAWAGIEYPRDPKMPRLCIQLGASAGCRSYPPHNLRNVIAPLHDKGWEIFFLDEPGRLLVESVGRYRNLSLDKLSFRQSCAVLNTADVFFGSDSALIHVAGALGVPAVGVYGAFPWELRTIYCPTTKAIQGTGGCSPCFYHKRLGREFPECQPCSTAGHCVVLAGIEPKRIRNQIELMARPQPVFETNNHSVT